MEQVGPFNERHSPCRGLDHGCDDRNHTHRWYLHTGFSKARRCLHQSRWSLEGGHTNGPNRWALEGNALMRSKTLNMQTGRLYPELHPWRALRPWKRHSLVLMVAGLVYICIGFSYIFAEPTRAKTSALSVALSWMPFEAWGGVFIFAGLLSIMSSRWPPVSKTWGYMVLTGLSAGWSAFYWVGIVFENSSLSNLSGVLAWGLIAFMWWAISGLLNPNDVRLPCTSCDRFVNNNS